MAQFDNDARAERVTRRHEGRRRPRALGAGRRRSATATATPRRGRSLEPDPDRAAGGAAKRSRSATPGVRWPGAPAATSASWGSQPRRAGKVRVSSVPALRASCGSRSYAGRRPPGELAGPATLAATSRRSSSEVTFSLGRKAQLRRPVPPGPAPTGAPRRHARPRRTLPAASRFTRCAVCGRAADRQRVARRANGLRYAFYHCTRGCCPAAEGRARDSSSSSCSTTLRPHPAYWKSPQGASCSTSGARRMRRRRGVGGRGPGARRTLQDLEAEALAARRRVSSTEHAIDERSYTAKRDETSSTRRIVARDAWHALRRRRGGD